MSRSTSCPDRVFTEFRLERIGCIKDPTMPIHKFRLLDGITSLGRNSRSDIVVPSEFASWNHCRFTVIGDIVQVYDMSSNGTFVNLKRISEPHTLAVGDLVGIGCSIIDLKELKMSYKYLVFKFVRTAMVSEVVELSSDDENEGEAICLDCDDDTNKETIPKADSTNSRSSDSDGDNDDISMIMSPNVHMEMKQELLDLDDYLWDLQHNPTKVKVEVKTEPTDCDYVDDRSSESHSGMLDMHHLSASRSPTIDNSTDLPLSSGESNFADFVKDALVVVKEEEQLVDRKPVITFLHDLDETIEIFEDDDDTLRTWKNKLSQKSDIGLKKTWELTEDVEMDVMEDDGCLQQNATELLDCSNLLVEMPQKGTRHYKKRKAPSRGRPPKKKKTIQSCQAFLHTVKLEPDIANDLLPKQPAPIVDSIETTNDPMALIDEPLPAIAEEPVKHSPMAKQLTPIVISLKQRQSTREKKSIQLIETFCQGARKVRAKNDKSKDIPKPTCKDNVGVRRNKLRELAEAAPKNAPKPRKAQTKPKVKNTPYRGAFLTDVLPPKPAELKRKIAAIAASKQPGLLENVQQTEGEQTKPEVKNTPYRGAILTNEASLPPKPAELKRKIAATAASKQPGLLEDVQQNEGKQLPVPKPQHLRVSVTAENEFIQANSTNNSSEKDDRSDKLDPSSVLRPILRASGGSRRTHRSIRFAEKLTEIREFQSHSDVDIDVDTQPVGPILAAIIPTVAQQPKSDRPPLQQTPTPEFHPLNDIINDITGWNPDWLQTPADMPNVNHIGYEPAAMLNNYGDFDSYLQSVVPIMKMEMWHCIHNEASHAGKMPINTQIHCAEYARRNKNFRYVFRCEVEMPPKPLSEDHLVLVTYSQGSIAYKFLAMIMHKEFDSMYQRIRFTMESSSGMANALNPNTPFVQIQILTHLMVELKQIKSILHLNASPLLHQILRPAHFPVLHPEGDVAPEKIIDHIGEQWSQKRSTINLIDGRPGTGKTRLIINLLFHFLFDEKSHRPHKIIVCAHNNAAVDVIGRELLRAQRLSPKRKFSVIRFGVHNRIHPDVRRVWTDELVRNGKSIETLELERSNLTLKLAANRVSPDCDAIKRAQDEQYFIGRLELVTAAIGRKRDPYTNQPNHHAEMQYQMNSADIVLTTLNSCAKLASHMLLVDVCIVDEANLCTEASVLLPLPLGVRSLVLVGDSRHAPYAGQSRKAAALGLGQSLFARIRNAFAAQSAAGGCPLFRLSRQYRMHPEICAWPDRRFYGGHRLVGNLASGERCAVRPYLLVDMPFVHAELRGNGRHHELANVMEAECVARLVRLLCGGIADAHCLVGVITPYQKQREELAQRLRSVPRCVVDSFDTIHGLERDIVIVSAARSHGGGYVTGDRLMAALTRARMSLIVCGNFDKVRNEDACWRSLLDDAADRKCYERLRPTADDQQLRRWIVEKLVKSNYQQFLF